MIGRPISELTLGDAAVQTRVVTPRMIAEFTETIGDENPLHSDPAFAERISFKEPIAPGILTGGLVSAVIGTELPGPGTLYVSQEFRFLRPVMGGDTITVRVEVAELVADRNRVRLKTVCTNQRGEDVLVGDAWVKPPKERIVYEERPATQKSTEPPVLMSATPWVMGSWAVQIWSQMALSALASWQHSPAVSQLLT